MPYQPHPHHRDPAYASQKSQWCIPTAEEVSVFKQAVDSGWLGRDSYWGLYLVGATPEVLGLTPSPEVRQVKLAKFVGTENAPWHGYPVAHWLSPWDKPAISVLRAWKEAGLINQPTFAKIHRGKPCVL